MSGKHPRSESPETSRPRRQAARNAAPPVPREDSVFSAITDVSEASAAADLASAYARIESFNPSGRRHGDVVKPALQAFLDFLPEDGRRKIVNDIKSAVGEDELYEVFSNLYTGLRARIRSRSKAPSVTPSPNPKRRKQAEVISSTLDTPIARQARFKRDLLARDGDKCVVTGQIDRDEYDTLENPPPDLDARRLEGAHVIPFSFGSWKADPGDLADSWEQLRRCFPQIEETKFGPENINDLSNGMILADWVHEEFGEMRIAFEETDVLHHYKIKAFKRLSPIYQKAIKESVVFKNHDSETSHELPNPLFLRCHYILAKIFHASGMAEAFDYDFNEWERLKESVHYLQEDGKTDVGHILGLSLWCDSTSG